MLFENNDFDVNMAFFMPDVNFEKETKTFEPMEGFLRGNMFKDEYLPYKNLTFFKLNPKTEREKMLNKIMALSFAVNDFNLYLDLNPKDKEIFSLFKNYVNEYEKLCKDYEQTYGPLEVTQAKGNKYSWIDFPWPWDNEGGSMYV